jgi:ATP/maltotriose-dependent transcriptional regulator MalT
MSPVGTLGAASQPVRHGYLEALEAALALDDQASVEQLVAEIEAMKPGGQPPFLRAQAARFRARLASSRADHDSVEQGFKTAEQIFREYGIPFWLAVTQLEHAEWLLERGRAEEAESLLAESREIFDRLEATPWLERAAQASPAGREAQAVAKRS